MSILLERIEMGDTVYNLEGDFQNLKNTYDNNVASFLKLLNRMNQIGNSQYLNQLITRLNFNNFYDMLTCDGQFDGFN